MFVMHESPLVASLSFSSHPCEGRSGERLFAAPVSGKAPVENHNTVVMGILSATSTPGLPIVLPTNWDTDQESTQHYAHRTRKRSS